MVKPITKEERRNAEIKAKNQALNFQWAELDKEEKLYKSQLPKCPDEKTKKKVLANIAEVQAKKDAISRKMQKNTLTMIKEELHDAPAEVKSAYNEVVKYFALGKGKERYVVVGWKTKEEADKAKAEAKAKKDHPVTDATISTKICDSKECAEKHKAELMIKYPNAVLRVEKF